MQSDNVKDSIKDKEKDNILSDKESFIASKIVRIAVASYRVTDFLPQDEPLKWKIRTIVAEMVVARTSQITDFLTRLSKLFLIATEGNIGSNMNFTILSRECEILKRSLIEEEREIIGEGHRLQREVQRPPLSSLNRGNKTEVGSRADKIITILREKGESNIGSIAAQLPSVSEKTVQRELITLVDNGIVNRVGERRWSRYRIAESD